MAAGRATNVYVTQGSGLKDYSEHTGGPSRLIRHPDPLTLLCDKMPNFPTTFSIYQVSTDCILFD